MAYQKNSGEHAFITLERDLKSGSIPGLVLLCGEEDYLTEHYTSVMIRRFVDPASRQLDLAVLSGPDLTADAVETNGETISLLSERRVILLPGFVNQRGKLPSQFEQGGKDSVELAALLSYFERIPEGVLLLITAEKPVTTGDYKKQSDGRKLKTLQTAVRKAGGAVYDFEHLDQNQLRGFIAKRFASAGKRCSENVIRTIIRQTGYGSRYVDYDLFTLENDLKKIIAHSGKRETITGEDLDGTLTISLENNVFRMLDAISQGQKGEAMIYLNTLLTDGDSEFGILGNLVRQLEMMLAARQMQDEGMPMTQVIAAVKKDERVKDSRAKAVAYTASRVQTRRLKDMLMGAYQVEEHIKTGLMDSRLALEYFIAGA